MKFQKLCIRDKDELMFGLAPHPVKTNRGLEIGGGHVYSELNFTLPAMKVNHETLPEISQMYKTIVTEAIERAIHLNSKGVIFEFETLLEMTLEPDVGVELVKVMNDVCEENFQKNGFKSEIRLTPNDIRDYERPPKMRTGPYLGKILELFDRGAESGGNLLSIESTGGKEIFHDAVMMCDMRQIIFSLSVLGVHDMKILWEKIVNIARRHNKIAGGDTACGFGNTAMVLAEKQYIPKVFAAVVRVATVVRSLIAVEQGATGPDKDCAYEGPFLKAIAGIPISMEGKTAACAHFSALGNISAACADMWSNESVQNIKLLSGMAPTVSLEQLEYDVRLMNTALDKDIVAARALRDLMVDSDAYGDPQALILAPGNVIEIAQEIVKGETYLQATINGCLKALDIIEDAVKEKALNLEEREKPWINKIRDAVNIIPAREEEFISQIVPGLDETRVSLSEYGIEL